VWAVPLPGQRALLPDRAVAVCPRCGGKLAQNRHWSELVAGCLITTTVLLYASLRSSFAVDTALFWGSAALIVWLAVFSYFHYRYWRHWQRYKAYMAPHER
jgi:uncharacterized paraquat-inducible protein A